VWSVGTVKNHVDYIRTTLKVLTENVSSIAPAMVEPCGYHNWLHSLLSKFKLRKVEIKILAYVCMRNMRV